MFTWNPLLTLEQQNRKQKHFTGLVIYTQKCSKLQFINDALFLQKDTASKLCTSVSNDVNIHPRSKLSCRQTFLFCSAAIDNILQKIHHLIMVNDSWANFSSVLISQERKSSAFHIFSFPSHIPQYPDFIITSSENYVRIKMYCRNKCDANWSSW